MASFDEHITDDEGYTHSITVDGKNILTKWGIEFSDGDHFFIHGLKDPNFKFKYEVKELVRKRDETFAHLVVQLSKTKIDVKVVEEFTPKLITRKYFLTPHHDVHFMDISISQAFPRELFSEMKVGEKTIPFDEKERNHQFETTHGIIKGKQYDLEINFSSKNHGAQLTPMMYGRPSPKSGWVIHSRLFPKNVSKKAIMWCHPIRPGRIPLSDVFSKIQPLVDYLWYVGERPDLTNRRTFGFASFALAKVPKDTCIEMTQTIAIKTHSRAKEKYQGRSHALRAI